MKYRWFVASGREQARGVRQGVPGPAAAAHGARAGHGADHPRRAPLRAAAAPGQGGHQGGRCRSSPAADTAGAGIVVLHGFGHAWTICVFLHGHAWALLLFRTLFGGRFILLRMYLLGGWVIKTNGFVILTFLLGTIRTSAV